MSVAPESNKAVVRLSSLARRRAANFRIRLSHFSGPIYDAKYSVLFNDESVTIISPTGIPVLKGWREATGNRLWRMSLLPNAEKVTTVEASPGVTTTSLKAYSAYNLPSVKALVR